MKGAVLLDLSNKEIFISRNITHHEHILPYKSSSPLSTWTYHPTPSTLHHQNNTTLPIHQPTPPSTQLEKPKNRVPLTKSNQQPQQSPTGNTFTSTEPLPLSTMENQHERSSPLNATGFCSACGWLR